MIFSQSLTPSPHFPSTSVSLKYSSIQNEILSLFFLSLRVPETVCRPRTRTRQLPEETKTRTPGLSGVIHLVSLVNHLNPYKGNLLVVRLQTLICIMT